MKNQKQLKKEHEQLKQEFNKLKQEHENTVMMMLQWKQKYGAEVSLSSQMQVLAIGTEAGVRELQGQVDVLNKKIDVLNVKTKSTDAKKKN